jgi:hypothetical protein
MARVRAHALLPRCLALAAVVVAGRSAAAAPLSAPPDSAVVFFRDGATWRYWDQGSLPRGDITAGLWRPTGKGGCICLCPSMALCARQGRAIARRHRPTHRKHMQHVVLLFSQHGGGTHGVRCGACNHQRKGGGGRGWVQRVLHRPPFVRTVPRSCAPFYLGCHAHRASCAFSMLSAGFRRL